MMKTGIAGAALVAGIMLPAVVQAQTAVQTWWVCAAEVPISKSVGVKMSWVGPAGRWNEAHNTYLAGFETSSPYEQAPALSDGYAAEYQAFLLASGYDLTPRMSGRTTDVACLYYRTEAERNQITTNLSTGHEERQGVKLELTPTYVQWQPAAAQTKPAEAVSASQPPPASANPVSTGLGAAFEDVSAQTAAVLGLETAKGAAVMAVDAGGPAEKAGLKRFDVVTEISGQVVEKAADVPAIVGRLRTGFSASVHVWRDKAFTDVTIEIPAPTAAPAPPAPVVAPSPLAAEVQNAIDLGLAAETKARARAKEAEGVATQAWAVAKQAEAEAVKATQGQAGYETTAYKNFAAGKLTYSGQTLKGETPVLGVMTYSSNGAMRAGGQVSMATINGYKPVPVLNGLGAYRLSPDDGHAGTMSGGALEGLGTSITPEKREAGEWRSGMFTGLGVATYTGYESAGEFSYGNLTGYGVVVLAPDHRWVGHFTNSVLDGPGIQYLPGGMIYKGLFSQGILITPVP